LTLQFSQDQSFNFSADWSSNPLLVYPDNTTLPQCAIYDESSSDFFSCKGCNITSYTNYNVTFGCSDMTLLCDGLLSNNRRLLDHSQILKRYDSIRTVKSSLFGAVLKSFKNTVTANPFTFSPDQNSSAGIVVGSLLLGIIFGSLWFTRWDRLDHDYIIYVKKDDKAMKLQEEIKLRHDRKTFKTTLESGYKSFRKLGGYKESESSIRG
jgi:hypothetical protein